jgi:hypothetical protein
VQAVADLTRLASVVEAGGEALAQPQSRIGGLEQHRAAVGTPVRLIELGDQWLGKKIIKQNRLSCGIVSHAKAS